jgi:ubiquinone/menaquinone biosynthesis C-methylase UbiE
MTSQYLGGSSVSEQQLWADVNGWMHMQSVQWEPAGRQLLRELGDGTGLRAVDMACGPLGWLRLLSQWVGPTGEVLGTEVTEATAEPARQTMRSEGISNVTIVADDIFDSSLPEHSFDLVHARFVLGPLGRPTDQLATFRRLVKPGGWMVLEEPDMRAWSFNPAAPANQRLSDLMVQLYGRAGRDVTIGRQIRSLLRAYSEEPVLRAQILVLPPGHAYRLWPQMGAAAIREQLVAEIGAEEVDALFAEADRELRDPELWCTTFALIQGYARLG